MTSKTAPEDKLTEIVSKFVENRNREEFKISFEEWIKSINAELKSQNKTDEEIGKSIGEICFRAGKMVTDPDANDMLKDVLTAVLLDLIVGLRYAGWKRS